ncbi:MAG: DHHW family protein [Bacilli bacterium]
MKKIYKKITTLIIFLIILSFLVALVFGKKEKFSPNENRYLKTYPEFSVRSLLNGNYIKDLEQFLTDQFPLRDFFMGLKTTVDKIEMHRDTKGVFFSKDGYLIQNYDKPINNNKIIKKLNEFSHKLKYVNFNLMLVPTSVTINKDKLPLNAPTYNQMDTINYIYKNIEFDTIPLYKALSNKDYQMFYKTDHHWTSYGAYFSYLEYAQHNNIEPVKFNFFKVDLVSDKFYGTLYSKSNDYSKKPDKIHKFSMDNENILVDYVFSKKKKESLYEEKYLKKKDKYSYFLDNNHPLIVITNKNINNNKELVVIKDSFANSFIPFLVNHYEKIHIIDPRFYKMSLTSYIKENKKIKDGLFLYNVNTVDSDIGILSIK